MFAQFTAWLGSLFKAAFEAIWTLLTDAFIWLLDAVLTAFSAIFAAIPLPEFVTGGLQSLWGQLPDGIVWALSASGLPACLAVVGTGFAFRILRKLFTLGQW